MSKDVEVLQECRTEAITPFSGGDSFEYFDKMAELLKRSHFLPKEFVGNKGDVLIILEMSARAGWSVAALLQNMYVVYGKPSFSSSFMVGLINSSGRFDGPIKYVYNETRTSCYAIGTVKGEEYRGVTVTIDMARAEGWMSKKGSKWATMPELMLQYRAISFFARAYCADIIMGMRSDQELIDGAGADQGAMIGKEKELNEKYSDPAAVAETVAEPEPEPEPKTTRIRSRPKVVASFKEEVDAIGHSTHLTRWAEKHRGRVERDLPKADDQKQVFEYANDRFALLIDQEKEGHGEPSEPPPEPADIAEQQEGPQKDPESFLSCPDGLGNVMVDYCNTECGKRKGCPAHN